MKVGNPSLRLGITSIIVLMVISSPIVILVNPSLIAAPFSAPSTLSQDGSDFTIQAALSSLSARPTNNIVNTNSFYDVVFLAATSGIIKTIEVTFPAGTTIPSGAFFNEAEGIGPGTASKSGQTITYTVTNAVNVPAGTKIRLEFANINNPLSPSASYKVTVTTRDAANAIIDGPTQSTAYTMKQIGANVIADNAITTNKIADGNVGTSDIADSAITTPKIADDSITTDKISDGSVSTNDIADNAVTTPKIADDAVTAAKIKEDLVHVVWKSNPGPNFDIMYKRDGAGFDPSTLTPQFTGGPQGEPAIAVSGNNVYLVWQEDFGGGSLEVIYTRSTDGGANFDPLQILSVTGGSQFNPSVAVSGNNVYVVWQVNFGGGQNDIEYRRSTDGGSTFGAVSNLSNNAGLSITPRVAASGNNVHVVWFDTAPGNNEILYRRSTDGGGTFDATTNLSNNTGNSGNPAITVSGNNVHVVWFDSTSGNDEILYRRSIDNGVTFDATVNISNDATNSNFPSIAVSGNNIHVVWIDDTATNDEIFYRRSLDRGVNFDITTNLSTRAGISTAPDIAVSGNNVYVVWQENLIPFASFAINYSMSTDGGATFEPQLSSLSNYWISDNRFPKIAVS